MLVMSAFYFLYHTPLLILECNEMCYSERVRERMTSASETTPSCTMMTCFISKVKRRADIAMILSEYVSNSIICDDLRVCTLDNFFAVYYISTCSYLSLQ